ncbi:redox-sensing transcriptional repressor Rex [Thermosulfurimonas dismutans]|uniref:Redox-sensing transcriptional repressor Rex n=1 Tax=Thermosulfurimonas dismutans TaxID=999894 RepID=A0A179D8J9_9BACT|nr:redox-sensing transcriptional repressor Rex [Thermosulfurimonas dismutans]OAQ21898.1 Redox-sensitive transcriptional regulator (AT-rich DNA-binding protein) [Thermosulfurimonas dismutans]
MKIKLPEVTVYRLALYLRTLEKLSQKGRNLVRSEELAELCGVSAAQLRKDLSFIGAFGVRGVGYHVRGLEKEIKRILGRDKIWHLALGGLNEMGKALITETRLAKRGFRFVAAFDWREEWVGQVIQEVYVYSLEQMPYIVKKSEIDIGVITLAGKEAEEMAERMSQAGIKAILNLGPDPLEFKKEGLILRNADLTLPFDLLAFALSQG